MSVETPNPAIDGQIQRELERALAGLRFGTVEVTVHNGRIVQIERREKVRLDDGLTKSPLRR